MPDRFFLIKLIGTFFGVGYLPLIPGTFGTLAGLGVYYIFGSNPGVFLFLVVAVTAVGFLISGASVKAFGKKDPRPVVIDEVSGILISLIGLPFTLQWAIAAFLLFRIFDSVKPYPVNSAENIGGGLGIMCDDIVAGLYTSLLLQGVARLAAARVS